MCPVFETLILNWCSSFKPPHPIIITRWSAHVNMKNLNIYMEEREVWELCERMRERKNIKLEIWYDDMWMEKKAVKFSLCKIILLSMILFSDRRPNWFVENYIIALLWSTKRILLLSSLNMYVILKRLILLLRILPFKKLLNSVSK